jgi:CheY-like chemotaxis protein
MFAKFVPTPRRAGRNWNRFLGETSMYTALVVDDERSTREMVAKLLVTLDIVPVQASDVSRALHILEDNRNFDLIVSDYQMPGLSGRELVTRVHEVPRYKSIPIIMISGVISLREINDLLGSGIEFFLPKPVNLRDLANYIEVVRTRLSEHELAQL